MIASIYAELSPCVGAGRTNGFQVKVTTQAGECIGWGAGKDIGAATAAAFSSLGRARIDAVPDLFAEPPETIPEEYQEVDIGSALDIAKEAVGAKVRMFPRQDGLWFMFADIAKIAGISNTTAFVRDLPDNQKSIARVPNSGLRMDVIVVSEVAAYKAFLRGRSSIATKMQEWLSSEVLPSLQRSAAYTIRT